MIKIDKQKYGPWALVTGASSGIGKEFARQLAANGLNVVLVARSQAVLEEMGRKLAKEYQIEYQAIGVDLSKDDFLKTVDAATQQLDIGLVVSNAGAGHPADFLSTNIDDLLEAVQLNAITHLQLAHHFGRKLAKRGRGGLLLVSAMGAAEGLPYMANDGAAKAYVLSLGKALNVELKKLGVNVSVLQPTAVETPVLAKLGLDAASLPMKPMPVEQCVDDGLTALNANRPSILAGRIFRILMGLMPSSVITSANGKMLAKALANKSA